MVNLVGKANPEKKAIPARLAKMAAIQRCQGRKDYEARRATVAIPAHKANVESAATIPQFRDRKATAGNVANVDSKATVANPEPKVIPEHVEKKDSAVILARHQPYRGQKATVAIPAHVAKKANAETSPSWAMPNCWPLLKS